MKFAAIDIGSNGIKFLISRPLEFDTPYPVFKKIEFTRLPLRLGDDVFKHNVIGEKKTALLIKSIKAFSLLMDVYNVDYYRACATSAMRDAENSKKIIKKIKEDCGIEVEIISGVEESGLIIKSFLHQLDEKSDYIHIDVGGGSTEISHLKNRKALITKSFNIGVVRMKEGKVKKKEWNELKDWVENYFPKLGKLKTIGTGGSMNKLYELANVKEGAFMSLRKLRSINYKIHKMSQHDRVYKLKLNPDRAEVIDYAGDIFINILEVAKSGHIISPDFGLKDGIVQDLWSEYFHDKKSPSLKAVPK
ncbi:MAG: phosphatase [Bacteroidia bacterium]|nr:phosphatase [Bacteroidia bacterium]MCO5253511.1 phosphatase [Bacteroidota bacterium]MCZ2129660.1 phosphatase [Bacteroidia bacterium]